MQPKNPLDPIVEDRNSKRFARIYDSMNERSERKLRGVRSALFQHVAGNVVELGPGTGANLRYYEAAERVTLVEPYRAMRKILADRVESAHNSDVFSIVDGRAECVPVDSQSIDTVVSTLVLCSVPDVDRTLAEIRRILKPTGVLVFLEHHVGTGPRSTLQHVLTPFMKKYAANCHLDRNTPRALSRSGFSVQTTITVPNGLSLRVSPTWPMAAGIATPS
ncbi:class I SAM-dependent methyltransferase [Dietzia sp.]|uniref:class I SAM-dependent methyltransferase n=1 Tax=Dietzia sp. TaxID=1871616 RepID=UPI003FA59A96